MDVLTHGSPVEALLSYQFLGAVQFLIVDEMKLRPKQRVAEVDHSRTQIDASALSIVLYFNSWLCSSY